MLVPRKDVRLVDFLISCGADVNAVTQHGETPLSKAAKHVTSGLAVHLAAFGSNLHTGLVVWLAYLIC
eukprot:m.155757 g.155757  ORF g.155757 m.155757 type:complete len:68 (+) comp16424_c0_seq12:1047-1250(+)